jgi:hypothetical protein
MICAQSSKRNQERSRKCEFHILQKKILIANKEAPGTKREKLKTLSCSEATRVRTHATHSDIPPRQS